MDATGQSLAAPALGLARFAVSQGPGERRSAKIDIFSATFVDKRNSSMFHASLVLYNTVILTKSAEGALESCQNAVLASHGQVVAYIRESRL